MKTIALVLGMVCAGIVQAQDGTSYLGPYMDLKDALVKSDASKAQEAAEKLVAQLEKQDMETDMIKITKEIVKYDDLAMQRKAFKVVTDKLIFTLKAMPGNQGVFVQHCPMAFNNSGANWLSMSEEIRNPYFGDMMLKCGRVEEKL